MTGYNSPMSESLRPPPLPNRPYRASEEHVRQLIEEMRVLDPERENEYQELQLKACGKFVEYFGQYLTSEETQYMQAKNVIITDGKTLKFLEEVWVSDAGYGVNKPLNGKLYTNYEVIDPDQDAPAGEEDNDGWDSARHFWSGRVAVAPVLNDYKNTRGLARFLLTDQEYTAMLSTKEINFSTIPEQVVAPIWSAMALHEKIHGIHRTDLPLPIMETATHFYEHATFAAAGWEPRYQTGFEKAITYWGNLAKELGPDLHRFVFGTLSGVEAQVIEAKLHARFTDEKIKELFSDTSSLSVTIQWITEPLESEDSTVTHS